MFYGTESQDWYHFMRVDMISKVTKKTQHTHTHTHTHTPPLALLILPRTRMSSYIR